MMGLLLFFVIVRWIVKYIDGITFISIFRPGCCFKGLSSQPITEMISVLPGVCVVPFGLGMCFASKRRAIFDLIWPDGSPPAALASLLFDLLEPQNIEKKTVFHDFATFSSDSFTCPIFILLLFSSLLFSSLILPIFAFPSVEYCRKFDFQTSLDYRCFTIMCK